MIVLSMMLWAGIAPSSVMRGDFDHDGRRDTARLLRQSGGITSVVIDRRGHPRAVVFREKLSDPFLTLNDYRGRVKTACGKGYSLDCRGVPNTVYLRGGEVMYGQYESTSYVVIWTGRRFRSIQLSD